MNQLIATSCFIYSCTLSRAPESQNFGKENYSMNKNEAFLESFIFVLRIILKILASQKHSKLKVFTILMQCHNIGLTLLTLCTYGGF